MEIFQGYIFVIDTNNYAGNFEREMCAFITGKVGDCNVGEKYAIKANSVLTKEQQEWFEYFCAWLADENGINRPVNVWSNPAYFNDGWGNYYKNDATTDMNKVREKYIVEVVKHRTKQIETNLVAINRDPEKYEYLKEVNNTINEIIEETKKADVQKGPAYYSVALFFNKEIPNEYIDLMKSRAKKFAKNYKIVIEGFRLFKAGITEVV